MQDPPVRKRQRSDRDSAEVVGLFARALHDHQRGNLQAARDLFQAVLAREPDHEGSLHCLGVIALQTGRHDLAIELIGRSIALNDQVPDFHYNIGIAYGWLGKFDQAIAHNRKAIELRPDHWAAHMNLGKALLAQGRNDEAIESYERVVALVPKSAEAHLGLANALAGCGKTEGAAAEYRKVLALDPRLADAHNNFGTLLAADGKRDEAIAAYKQAIRFNPGLAMAEVNLGAMLAADRQYAEACACFQRALALRPDLVAAHNGLGKTLQGMGDLERALEAFCRAESLDNTVETRALLHTSFTDPRAVEYAPRYRESLTRAMSEPLREPREMMAAALTALASDPVISKCREKTWHTTQASVLDPIDIRAMAKDQLLLAVLQCERTAEEGFERLLTAMRAMMLDQASQLGPRDPIDDDLLALHCALARQCFLTEYVFACSEQEAGLVRTLNAALHESLKSGAEIQPRWIAAAASYRALHTLPKAEVLQSRQWPTPVAAVIEQQIGVPRDIQRCAAAIPRLTPIEDAVSLLVASQYEDSPYPRWEILPVPQQPKITIAAYLRDRFPAVRARLDGDADSYDYLVAGCGTGRHVAGLARSFGRLRLDAIDLSRASLGYAKYKADSIGITDIAYAQADILALATTGKSYDVVDCIGVLHHMAVPEAGWKILLGCLRPRGCMRLGFYSKMARRNIIAARRHIAERGYGQSVDEIRRCRQDFLAHPDGTPEKEATRFWDFYGLSDCRDLLFHVQEHQLTLPQIGHFIAENDLELIGLEVNGAVQQQYSQRFSSDPAMINLENWHVFEQAHPDVFKEMYVFWVQRKM